MKNIIRQHPVIPFTLRFIAIHTLTYLTFGIFFMLVSRYFEYFKSDPVFDLAMKPSGRYRSQIGLAQAVLFTVCPHQYRCRDYRPRVD